MGITHIFSFLVHPAKGVEEQPDIRGTTVPLRGNLYRMLSALFDKSGSDCNIEISFSPAPDGRQQNDCRDEIIRMLNSPTTAHARGLAARLQLVTTNRSGLGLLFLILGRNSRDHKVCISRFPADFGILAEENKKTLRVEFLEKVFMRNALAYKAVVYEGSSFDSHFWTGRAVDKQINGDTAISNYWIRDFLMSDFKTTSAAGTRRLAIAMKDAMNSTADLGVKQEITAAALLLGGLDGQTISIDDFSDRFGFSNETKAAVLHQLKKPALRFEQFQFSSSEFEKHLPYRSIELSNGAILTAGVSKFEDCFKQTQVDEAPGEYEFRTSGRIVNERLRKSK